jgi:hypothetical protein
MASAELNLAPTPDRQGQVEIVLDPIAIQGVQSRCCRALILQANAKEQGPAGLDFDNPIGVFADMIGTKGVGVANAWATAKDEVTSGSEWHLAGQTGSPRNFHVLLGRLFTIGPQLPEDKDRSGHG